MVKDFDLGNATSYSYYVSEGGTKTPQEFGEMLVNIDTVASRAEESASDAEESATSANESKESAVGSMNVAIAKANEASASAEIAVNKAGEASASATTATNKASEASASATTASAKATESSQNAQTAVGAKNDAVSAKNDAVTAKTQAQSAKDDAVSAKLGAESARDQVQSSANQITQNASDITQLKSELTDVRNTIPEIDSTLSTAGKAADAKETGDEIDQLKSGLDPLINVKRFTKVNQNAQIYEYSFVKGTSYTISNKSASGAVWLKTCTSDGTEIEVIRHEMASGTSLLFIPSQNASYLRIYSNDVAERIVEVSTYGEIIADIENRLTSESKDIDALVETGDRYKNWQVYRKPEGFSIELPLTIYTDGYSYVTDYDKEDHKNASANIWYISPTGNNSNTGKYPDQAWKTFYYAYTKIASGDTVVLMEGDYDRDNDIGQAYQKSVNIIGEGKVRIFNGNFSPFSAVSGYSNVYKATRSYGERVYEVDTVGDDICRLTLVDSIESVESTEGSYYKTGNDFYVHPLKSGTPNATGGARIFISLNYDDLFSANNQNQDVKFYLENVTIVGSAKSCRYDRVSSSNSLDVCLDNVRFVWCGSEYRNAVELFGGNLILHKCTVHGSYRDGFNYNGTDTSGSTLRDNCIVEINCSGTNCGFERTETNMNASTAHHNSKVIRINGYYSECHGANCADVQEGTESINLGCVSFNSGAVDGYNGGFSAQQAGTKMWLENCIAIGSLYDIHCVSGAEMTMNRCTYDTKLDNGTITETNHVPVSVWMIKNKENIK